MKGVSTPQGIGARLAKTVMAMGLVGGLLAGGSMTSTAGASSAPGQNVATKLDEPHVVLSSGMSGNLTNRLDSVSCTGTADCLAVGGGGNPPDSTQTLAEFWNGTAWGASP
jgi:hypothetical protein